MPITISVQQLSYEREQRVIFSDLDFNLQTGELLQVVGANGSGKTTLLRLLAGLIQPTHGMISWCAQPISQSLINYQANLFYLGHKTGIKGELTPCENLKLMTALMTIKPTISIEEALIQVGLKQYLHRLSEQLSAGQQRRLALAKLIIAAAKLWILDEPFTALDALGVNLVEALIAQQLAQGGMVILTSHQLFELPHAPQKKLLLN